MHGLSVLEILVIVTDISITFLSYFEALQHVVQCALSYALSYAHYADCYIVFVVAAVPVRVRRISR